MTGLPWCACKRLRGDSFVGGRHERCGQLTQGGPDGVTPLNLAAALRDDGRTGVGTPGDGIGEPGDPAPTLSVSGATPAVYVKVHRAQNVEDYESWDAKRVAGTLNVFDVGDTRATAVVITEEERMPDSKTKRKDPVDCVTANSVQHYDVKSAQAGHLLVDAPPLAECGCCPADPKPDSSRYRACGNAVTVNVAEWIGHRLLPMV